MGTSGRRRMSAPTPAGSGRDARLARLEDGVRGLDVVGRRPERRFMVLGGVLVPLGLLVVLLGWYGASRTSNVFEQVPYLISGGLLGLALTFLGAFLYFAHWLTRLVHEQRSQAAALVAAVDRLACALDRRPSPATPSAGASSGNGGGHVAAQTARENADSEALVVTASGTLAHRPTCRVVAGKPGVRPVTASDDLAPCRLCQPYG